MTLWGALADHAVESVRKGDRVMLSGNLREEQWTDEQGQVRSAMVVRADELAVSVRWGVASSFDRRSRDVVPAE